jgi:hypothetical protein
MSDFRLLAAEITVQVICLDGLLAEPEIFLRETEETT